ncbi:16S rRNA (cytosine(1402)-N(4))-methyltransferase RsmH [Candidatus Similichlamydia epinepheli]|uniref:16S rRNA (cytosine(1402)-N(4))-methyltransferase RsmH n=1 Tax=Candidatus Similichlamydia epinepheli TaxID=1903953 RepID=UPI003B967B6D
MFSNCFSSWFTSDFASFAETAVKDAKTFDFLLMDLGVSSFQLDDPDRGFSFRFGDALLDMRMNPEDSRDAFYILHSYSEKELSDLFFKGELPRSRQIAKLICSYRNRKSIKTVEDLLQLVSPVLKKNRSFHPATLLFQALRMEVNQELKQLEKILELLPQLLKENGTAAVISFHSLEDRVVKNSFRNLKQKQLATILTKKPLTASQQEKKHNPRSRSAKMRVIKCTTNAIQD